MSDSLRDQLLNAGFAETAKPPKAKKKRPAKHKPRAGVNAGKPKAGVSADKPVQIEPKAGYTHVPATPPKKKKSKKAPAVKPRAGSWSTRAHSTTPVTSKNTDPAAAERRRKMKSAIQALIEANALKQFKGEEIYRFTLQNKIRELLVTEAVRKQLVNAELAITRLNGATQVIPAAVATEIRAINPQWVIFMTNDADSSDDDDEEFPIPDDLIW